MLHLGLLPAHPGDEHSHQTISLHRSAAVIWSWNDLSGARRSYTFPGCLFMLGGCYGVVARAWSETAFSNAAEGSVLVIEGRLAHDFSVP